MRNKFTTQIAACDIIHCDSAELLSFPIMIEAGLTPEVSVVIQKLSLLRCQLKGPGLRCCPLLCCSLDMQCDIPCKLLCLLISMLQSKLQSLSLRLTRVCIAKPPGHIKNPHHLRNPHLQLCLKRLLPTGQVTLQSLKLAPLQLKVPDSCIELLSLLLHGCLLLACCLQNGPPCTFHAQFHIRLNACATLIYSIACFCSWNAYEK